MLDNLEKNIGKYHHRLELIRTVVPVLVLILQCTVLYHLLTKG